jgi:hypothetical protein
LDGKASVEDAVRATTAAALIESRPMVVAFLAVQDGESKRPVMESTQKQAAAPFHGCLFYTQLRFRPLTYSLLFSRLGSMAAEYPEPEASVRDNGERGVGGVVLLEGEGHSSNGEFVPCRFFCPRRGTGAPELSQYRAGNDAPTHSATLDLPIWFKCAGQVGKQRPRNPALILQLGNALPISAFNSLHGRHGIQIAT